MLAIKSIHVCLFLSLFYFDAFSYKILLKHMNPEAGPFWPKGHSLNKLRRGLLGNVTNQISRLFALWFQGEDFFMFFLYNV